MDTSPLLSKLTVPVLSPRENAGPQDYWRIYEQHRDEVEAELWRVLMAIPEIKASVGDRDLTDPEQKANIERQRQAIYENNWEPFLLGLWQQGQLYAHTGVGFNAWFEIVSAFRKLVRPYLLAAYGASPERLLAAMEGADVLIEIMMSSIGSSYLEAKQRLIQQQEMTIQVAIERERMDEIFRGLLESAPDAIVVVDSGGKITPS